MIANERQKTEKDAADIANRRAEVMAAVDGEPLCPLTAVERPYFERSVGNSRILMDGLSACGKEKVHTAAAENAEAKEAEAK